MKIKISLCALACCSLPAVAAESISYDALLNQSNGDATPRSLLGKNITVAAKGYGELGFFTAKGKELTFVCKTGDKALTAKKPKPQTFTGTLQDFQGWEGATVWTLTNCEPGAGTASSAAPASRASAVGVSAVTIKGDGNSTGSPLKPKLQTLEGTVFADKDPGGWYFGIKAAGKKPVRLSYQGDAFSKALLGMEEKNQTVKATGYVGNYSDGSAAFDNARDVVIEVIAK